MTTVNKLTDADKQAASAPADQDGLRQAVAELRYDKAGLIPAVVQHYESGQVLMVAYMNEESLMRTIETGETWFYSRSQQELWHKGGTSGNVQKVVGLAVDCDEDTLLVQVDPAGPACHTGADSCFYRSLQDLLPETELPAWAAEKSSSQSVDMLYRLKTEITEKKEHPTEKSYTAYLLAEGTDKICKKIGEESAEVIIGAKNQSPKEIISESADLLYHLLVLWQNGGVDLSQVMAELDRRSQKEGNKKEIGHLDKTF